MHPFVERCFANRFVHRIAYKAAFALAMGLSLLWSAASALYQPGPAAPAAAFHEWPQTWDGAALRPLALGEVEQRFAERFPGAMARFTDGRGTLVLRQPSSP